MTSPTPLRMLSMGFEFGCALASFVQEIFCRRLVPIVIFLVAAGTSVGATTIQYTITVEMQGQPVPDMTLVISISDAVANSRYYRYARTNAQGSFTATATFECGSANQITFGIGAVKVLATGMIEAGGGIGGSRNCGDASPITLALATSTPGAYDRHNAGDGCVKMVGKPVNVTNGNMFIRQDDYY